MVSSLKSQCSLKVIFLITIINIVIAQKQSPPSTFHIPIKKDPKTLQHYATFQIGTPPTEVNAVLDLAGTFLSLACNNHASSTRRSLSCNSATCQALANPPTCGAKNKNDTEKCVVSSTNPFSVKSKFSGELNSDLVTLHATDGTAALITTRSAKVSFDCVGKSENLLTGLAGGSAGIFGLGGTTTASLFTAYGIAPKFALCVPSSTELGFGDLFIGGGRYTFAGGVNAGEWLSITPLSRPDGNGAGYSISAKSVKIDKRPIRRTAARVEISTATRYGALESSLFSAVVTEFSRRATARNMTRVAAVKPFGACFKARGVHWTTAGPRVPAIEIELDGNAASVYWRINGGNSMVRVSEDVMCLGFIDGGVKAKSPVVLGSLQIEDNFLEFDLSTSRLGFSSSILPRGVSCSNFRNQ